jgi:SPX domain protein involved in polyphosphate accumulation
MAEATGRVSGYRYERKFVTTMLGPREVDTLIRLHPCFFREIHHERFVNNIYFDTPSLAHYEANVVGLAERLKCRVRWYGELLGGVQRPVLELKRKYALLGTKESHLLPPFDVDEKLVVRSIFEGADLPETLKLYLGTLQPTLMNRYRRRYYLSADGDYRITVDWDLEFRRIGPFANSFREKSLPSRRVVVELKYDRGKEALADRITSHMRMRLSKMSKYVTGLDTLYPW